MTTLETRPETVKHTAAPFAAPAPRFHHGPQKIAEDTFVIRQLVGEGTAPVAVYINSMVITGKQPVVVDTGTQSNRREWFNDVLSLVDPDDVKFIYISHDDHDHTGNLAEAMQVFRNATLVTNWFQLERLSGDYEFPFTRMRWVEDGDTLDVGDRRLAAIRPPVFDAPTTRGLYDPKTGVYWASDCFATPVVGPTDNVRELHPEEWRQGLQTFSMAISPWISLTDEKKFGAQVKRIDELDIKVISSAHTPPITGCYVESAIDVLYDLPSAPRAQLPVQADLEAILRNMQQI
jgi:flavorubredoxin